MKTRKELAIYLGVALLLIFYISKYFFFYNNKITNGSSYFLTIGMSKKEVIESINSNYPDDIKIILSPDISKFDISETTYTDKKKLKYTLVKYKKVWEIRYKGSEKNVLVLIFMKDKLVKMHRYRRLFIP